LFKEVFDRVQPELKKNLTLLHECILSRVAPVCGTTFGRYKFADFVGPEFDVMWESISPDIVNEIHDQTEKVLRIGRPYTWPDASHMSVVTTLYFIDDLMCAVEGK
jgi:hypothetical protein